MKGTIMVVDDNANLLKTMDRILTMKGYEVITASSGLKALERAKSDPNIDVIFMDIKMPLLNGVETHKQMKKILPNAVVFMMTAYAVEELIQEALGDGVYGILHKPLEMDNIVELIGTARDNDDGALIMIVDDDSGLGTSLKNILERKGFSVTIAIDGLEAIEIAKDHLFDILFIDMKLPTINGLDTFLAIKELRPEAVAVMITGYATDYQELVKEAMDKSAYSCLHKPLDMMELFSIIEDILSKKLEGSEWDP